LFVVINIDGRTFHRTIKLYRVWTCDGIYYWFWVHCNLWNDSASMFNLSYNFYHWHHILNQSINVMSNTNYFSNLRTLYRMYLKFTKMNVWDDDTKSMYTYLPSNPLSSGHTRKSSLSPSFRWTPVGTRISLRCRYALWLYIDFVSSSHTFILVNFRYVKHFSCPRPILILNLEALLFCFDKHESDLNFNMHVL
jgi:hypothetical protein